MTTIAFAPNNSASPPFSTVFTLDGQNYNCVVGWNVYAQRWYFTLTDQAGTIYWTGPLIGSPMGSNILLAPGVFSTSTLLYRESTGQFEIEP